MKSSKQRDTEKKVTKKKLKKPAKNKVVKKNALKSKVKTRPKTNSKSRKPVVRIGEVVAELTLQGTLGEINLSQLRGKKVVLYFYPKDATPGCTLEGRDFSRLLSEFQAANTEVFGISRDTMSSHEKFRTKENYKVHLLSDTDEVACQHFDVIKMKNMYGKQVRGIERSTFVLDENGKLIREWRKVSVPGHADEVLQYVKLM